MPRTPIAGTGARAYASSTLVPREITVSTTDISGFPMPL